jgi:hypothetical protein
MVIVHLGYFGLLRNNVQVWEEEAVIWEKINLSGQEENTPDTINWSHNWPGNYMQLHPHLARFRTRQLHVHSTLDTVQFFMFIDENWLKLYDGRCDKTF